MRDDSGHVLFPVGFLKDLAAADSFDGVLGAAARWLLEIVQADRASVALLDPEQAFLKLFALEGNQAIPVDTEVPIDNTMIGQCIIQRQQRYTRNLADHPAVDARTLAEGGLGCSVNSPLVSSGQCFGSVNVSSTAIDGFTAEHLHALNSVAGLLASYMRVHSEMEAEQERVRTDELTGLLSRRTIIEELRRKLASGVGPVSILYIDLDDFKLVNDTYGHRVGDQVLREMARRFNQAVRAMDMVGRVGGDEFLVLLDNPSDESEAVVVANRLVATCRQEMKVDEVTLTMRPSVGVAMATDDRETAEHLLIEADMAMYRAKGSPDPVAVADASVRHHVELVAAIDRDLEAAVINGRLDLHYQPVRRLDTGEVLSTHRIEPERSYWRNQRRDPGRWPGSQATQ